MFISHKYQDNFSQKIAKNCKTSLLSTTNEWWDEEENLTLRGVVGFRKARLLFTIKLVLFGRVHIVEKNCAFFASTKVISPLSHLRADGRGSSINR